MPSSGLLCGSSPRVRGTVHADPVGFRVNRFIPACAGNGPRRSRGISRQPVHPRVCGERVIASPVNLPIIGSSPRVRGTVRRIFGYLRFARFIPACAGNGCSTDSALSRNTVHPRVCGERLWSIRRSAAMSRFIPACAGNGPTRSPTWTAPPVHPRVCGERSAFSASISSGPGSSPRVRGTVQVQGVQGGELRFIPACAGNGGGPDDGSCRAAVHPRVCGERG